MPNVKNDCYRSPRMRALRMVCLPVCLFLSTGCMVGPDYQLPSTSVPASWTHTSPTLPNPVSVATSQTAELAGWWSTFNDSVLASLVERAIASSPDIRLATARIRQARATRGTVAAGLWPEIDASASYRRSYTGASTSGSSISYANSAQDLFKMGLDASWELDFFGGTRRNVEASDADVTAAVEDRRDVLVTLAGEVATNYINLRGYQRQIDIARRNLAAQQHMAEITRKRHAAGFVSRLDVANANAEVASTRSQIPVLQSLASASIYSIGVLLGLPPTTLEEELSSDGTLPSPPPEVPVGLPSDLLRRRPDIRRSEAQVHAATARIGVATADLFPKFSLTGSLGIQGTEINALGGLSNRFWAVGPTVSWPVFDAGRIRWNIEIQNAVQEQTLITYEKTILAALGDVEKALVAYGKEQERMQFLSEEVKENRQAVDLSTKLYVAGRTDFLNVLTAQRSLYTSEEALALCERNLSTTLVALYKALGGGWEVPFPGDRPKPVGSDRTG